MRGPLPIRNRIFELEGPVRLSGNLEHEMNSEEVSLHSKASKCLVPDET